MKKELLAKAEDELLPDYDLTQLRGGVRGKYYERAKAGTNLVLIEPDLAEVFPTAEAVNRALRVVAEAAEAAVFGLPHGRHLPEVHDGGEDPAVA